MSDEKISPFVLNPLVLDSPDEPFKNDFSGKLENFASNLTAFIEGKTKDAPLVISLSAPWGMGKTAFIDMWGQWLYRQNKLAIKYDAWHEDYSENPLLSILATINEQLELYNKDKKITGAIQAIKTNGLMLCKAFLPAIIKFIINCAANYVGFSGSVEKLKEDLGLLDNDEIKKLGADIGDELKKGAISFIQNEIKAHQVKKTVIEEFKLAIEKLFTDEPHKRLFFFVDELDRCKPTFALAVLETIKHFFDIKKVCFIVVNNQQVLFEMFRKVYGHTFESEGYFERFIDRHVVLPEPDIDNFVGFKLQELSILNDLISADMILKKVIIGCCKLFGFSFREVSKYLNEVADFFIMNHNRTQKKIAPIYFSLMAYLIALKKKHRELFDGFLAAQDDKLILWQMKENKVWPIQNLEKDEQTKLEWDLRFFIASQYESLFVEVLDLLKLEKKELYSKRVMNHEETIKMQLLSEILRYSTVISRGDGSYHEIFSDIIGFQEYLEVETIDE